METVIFSCWNNALACFLSNVLIFNEGMSIKKCHVHVNKDRVVRNFQMSIVLPLVCELKHAFKSI